MKAFYRGVPWPDALVAADATLPAGRQLSGHCRLADGQLAYFGRWKSGYLTQLPEVSKEFRTRDLWRAGLQEQLVLPRLCRSLAITVNRNFDFDVALDGRDLVVKVTERAAR
jgi:hypothetical protein